MRKERALYLPDDLNFILDFTKIYSNCLIEEGMMKVLFSMRYKTAGLKRGISLGTGMKHLQDPNL